MSASLEVDGTPARATTEMARWLDRLGRGVVLGVTTIALARSLHAHLSAAGLQVVEAVELARLHAAIRGLDSEVALARVLGSAIAAELHHVRLKAEGSRAAIVHSAQVLDQEHAALASQLALAMHWGGELLEHHVAESTALIEKLRRARSQLALATEWGLLLSDLYRDARKARLDVELLLELQRAEYGRLLEVERARGRKLELELDKVRDAK